MPVNPKRVRTSSDGKVKKGPVVYWMSRDQRARDNWALIYAQELAQKGDSDLAVAFCLAPEFLGATRRQYSFMLQGLREVEQSLRALNIPFFLRSGDPGREIPDLLNDLGAGTLVSDFSPLRQSLEWKTAVAGEISLPFYEVDAHNIIPCWFASPKQEWAAYSFRPKVHRLLSGFMEEFPAIHQNDKPFKDEPQNDWDALERSIQADNVSDVNWIMPGENAAAKHLWDFLEQKLSLYEANRNNPTLDGQSNLSPYLHFGQIAASRVASEAIKSMKDAGAFLEELIVRRELSDNFCYYNQNYDNLQGFPAWARSTLEEHARDRREYLYTPEELERAHTHDDLWNAAQLEMVRRGKMHGYMRMYWAKKILEWSPSPAEALCAAIYLNDRYELDGRDPNGYVGAAWSIGGVHDRAWKERAIYGKVRYMSYDGAKRKFDVQGYIRTRRRD
jgi:deoxyribodipyrimidine photo-lyase